MSITEAGREGESLARDFLKAKDCRLFQPDWMAEKNGKYFVVEVKHQEAYEPPPFYGHGLPMWQVQAREAFREQTKIPTMFLVRDAKTELWIWQWLTRLEAGQYHDTRGKSPRRVYPITLFEGGANLLAAITESGAKGPVDPEPEIKDEVVAYMQEHYDDSKDRFDDWPKGGSACR